MITSNQGDTSATASAGSDVSRQECSKESKNNAHKMHSRGDVRYWQGKVHKVDSSPDFSIQVAFAGRRVRFPLKTPRREAAAKKALAIYQSLAANGWDATLATYKPSTAKPTRCATLGELLAEVKATAGFRSTTFNTYSQCLRQITAEIVGIGDQPALDEHGEPKLDKKKHIIYLSRFDHRKGGREAWAAKVEAMTLDTLTAEAVQRWRLRHVEKAGNAPDAMRKAQTSANSTIRSARSLFSEKALKFAREKLILPQPLPFAGAKLEKGGSTRYISKIDAATLIAQAGEELTGEPLKIFYLGLLCGLRKREVDLLLWRQVDFTIGQIRVEATEYFHPKSEDSIGQIDLDDELLALLRGWKAQSAGEFVISSNRLPRHNTSRTNYRCTPHFEALYLWLRSKGIDARKPFHELRKELGAILASNDGIFAAQNVLRHAQISTTAAYYTDKKKRITAGLGSFLVGSGAKVGGFKEPPSEAKTAEMKNQ